MQMFHCCVKKGDDFIVTTEHASAPEVLILQDLYPDAFIDYQHHYTIPVDCAYEERGRLIATYGKDVVYKLFGTGTWLPKEILQ
jgi:hypothetical protein